MKQLFESWRKHINEEEEGLDSKIRKALVDEGGAAGMDALKKHTGASEEDIKAKILDMPEVARHPNGDYILEGGDVQIEEKKGKGDPCWDGYKQVGKKMKGGKKVPNCVPV